MKFRRQSNHSVCNVCLRHKMLLQELSGHLNARKSQLEKYTDHLKSQYEDRLAYWALRGESRLRGKQQVTLIIDSMDQAKFSLPRGTVMKSKDPWIVAFRHVVVLCLACESWNLVRHSCVRIKHD